MSEVVNFWRNLSAGDVYHVAHLENEAIDAANMLIDEVQGHNDALVVAHRTGQLILRNHETRASAWLKDQNLLRATELTHLFDFTSWLEQQFLARPDILACDVARLAGISEESLSRYRHGKVSPRQNIALRIQAAFQQI